MRYNIVFSGSEEYNVIKQDNLQAHLQTQKANASIIKTQACET